ncbi:hypothetical protein Fcan01_16378 [Folsomia candida]|uniref:Uncharacterized protein n=1 Tax=Folsomia candida TaxID=158441 RepID=A0A226DTT2_FOLCA|nr:hypothetical protein Fcan01_16378 [Folsomia candida]
MGRFILILVRILSVHFCTLVSPSKIQFKDFELHSILVRLNSSCQYFIVHHGLMSEQISTGLSLLGGKGFFILKVPFIDLTQVIGRTHPRSQQSGIFNRVSKSVSHCFITIHLIHASHTIWGNSIQTKYSAQYAWRLTAEKLLDKYMVPMLYSASTGHFYESYFHSAITLPLLLQVLIDKIPGNSDAKLDNFKIFKLLGLVVVENQTQTWYKICLLCLSSPKATLLREDTPVHAMIDFLVAPTDLKFDPRAKYFPGVTGDFNNARACLSELRGPFELIRKHKVKPYAYLFFALVCHGNYSHGNIAELTKSFTRSKPQYKGTYLEIVSTNIDRLKGHRRLDFYLTDYDGFSFLTCYSRQVKLSFKAFLQPFQPPLWIGLITTILCLTLYLALILKFKFGQTYASAFSVSQFFIVSTIFEKPIPLGLSEVRNSLQFRLVVGIWLVLFVNFTNSYLSLSITSLSAPLGTKSVKLFEQLTKPGCSFGPTKNDCYLARLRKMELYLHTIFIDELVWQKRQAEKARDEITGMEPFNYIDIFASVYQIDPNKTRELILTLTTRSFSEHDDFTLLPYPTLKNIADYNEDVYTLTASTFYDRLVTSIGMHLTDPNYVKVTTELQTVIDLLDPLHITHPAWPTSKGKEISKNVTDVGQMLVSKCDKTVLVGKEVYISKEMMNFQKYYKSIQFFKSKEQILRQGTGWSFGTTNLESIPFSRALNILRKLYEVGIIQMLEKFPTGWSHRRENGTLEKQSSNPAEKEVISSKISSIKIGGTIQAIFWIWILLIILSALIFSLFEFCPKFVSRYGWDGILLKLYKIGRVLCTKGGWKILVLGVQDFLRQAILDLGGWVLLKSKKLRCKS